MSTKRIMLVGGGTGGHFYPLMAIAEALVSESQKKGDVPPELYYIGPNAYDPKSLQAHNISFVSCPAGKRRRYRSVRNVFDMFKIPFSIVVALYKLFVLYPDVVMSKGGYTSVPVVLTAWILRIPIIIHESDAAPGRANKIAGHFARYIAISYPETADFFPEQKTVTTGIPVRKVLLEPVQGDARAALGIDSDLSMLLVFGGSQGAERINQLILESLDELLPYYAIIHQTGATHIQSITDTAKSLVTDATLSARYHPMAFMSGDILNQAMHSASVIISRAGSGSIYEIALHGKPSIIIPIPETISHDQRTNAYAYARTGAATVMEEENLRDGLLAAEIARIMDDRGMYAAMSEAARSFANPYAAEKLALTLIELANTH